MFTMLGMFLDLAVRGYLRIEEVDSVVFVFLRNRDWRLVKLREGEGLRPDEALLFERLFAARESVTVSSLRNRFYAHLPALRDAIYDAVSREGRYFPTSPHRVRRVWAAAGFAGLFGGGVALALTATPATAVAVALSGALVLLFSRVMPRRTARGRAMYEQILGFREFVMRVDKDRLERMDARTTERFERVLPYALVLDARRHRDAPRPKAHRREAFGVQHLVAQHHSLDFANVGGRFILPGCAEGGRREVERDAGPRQVRQVESHLTANVRSDHLVRMAREAEYAGFPDLDDDLAVRGIEGEHCRAAARLNWGLGNQPRRH